MNGKRVTKAAIDKALADPVTDALSQHGITFYQLLIAMGNVWMQRIEGMEKPEEPQNATEDCVLYPHKTWESPREPTVSDTPSGSYPRCRGSKSGEGIEND